MSGLFKVAYYMTFDTLFPNGATTLSNSVFSKSTLFLFPQGYEIIHHTCCFRVNESQHACSLRNVFHIFFVYGHFKVIDLLDVAEYQMSVMIQTDVFSLSLFLPVSSSSPLLLRGGSLGWSHLGPCTSRVCLESGFPLFSQCTYLLLVHYLPVCKDQFEPSLIWSSLMFVSIPS